MLWVLNDSLFFLKDQASEGCATLPHPPVEWCKKHYKTCVKLKILMFLTFPNIKNIKKPLHQCKKQRRRKSGCCMMNKLNCHEMLYFIVVFWWFMKCKPRLKLTVDRLASLQVDSCKGSKKHYKTCRKSIILMFCDLPSHQNH